MTGFQSKRAVAQDKMEQLSQRPWVDLTEEEIDDIDKATWDEDHKSWGIHDFARAVLAKSKEKNT